MKQYIWLFLLILLFVATAFGPNLKGTSQRVVSGNRIEVEEVKIDTCVYHVFTAYSSHGIFVIRVK